MKRGARRCVISWRQPESNNQRPFEEGRRRGLHALLRVGRTGDRSSAAPDPLLTLASYRSDRPIRRGGKRRVLAGALTDLTTPPFLICTITCIRALARWARGPFGNPLTSGPGVLFHPASEPPRVPIRASVTVSAFVAAPSTPRLLSCKLRPASPWCGNPRARGFCSPPVRGPASSRR